MLDHDNKCLYDVGWFGVHLKRSEIHRNPLLRKTGSERWSKCLARPYPWKMNENDPVEIVSFPMKHGGSFPLCKRLPEGSTPLNPIKPPFSYGFPVVFLWFLRRSSTSCSALRGARNITWLPGVRPSHILLQFPDACGGSHVTWTHDII